MIFIAIDECNINDNINKLNREIFNRDLILDKIFEDLHSIIEYDFLSDLNVNILGSIFEQSITDLEELKKELKIQNSNEGYSSRKKEGIFYTPQFITKYIVENTLGKHLDDLYLKCKHRVEKWK